MPRPDSKPGIAITSAPFESPFETIITRFGLKGINLTDAIDGVEPDELVRMLNVTHRQDYAITPRPGLTTLATAGTNHHSIRRLNDPTTGNAIRVHGVDTSLYGGASGGGALTLLDSGYSGSPLSMVPYHSPFAGETWMYVADSARMRKVRSDGLDLPIGLPLPSQPAAAALEPINKQYIANFIDDGTDATSWIGVAGFTYAQVSTTSTTPSVPIQTDIPVTFADNPPDGSGGVSFQTNPGAAAKSQTSPIGGPAVTPNGYYSFWSCPVTRDLSKVNGITATDDDYIHLWINLSHTDQITEVRLYFVCGTTAFAPALLPGQNNTKGENQDFYVKSFTANDFAAYVQGQVTALDAAELARLRSIRQAVQVDAEIVQTLRRAEQLDSNINNNLAITLATQEALRLESLEAPSPGSNTWQEMGIVGLPVRRGEFQRIGTTTNAGWQNITGIIVFVSTGPESAEVAVRFGDLYMHGGAGPDSGDPAAQPYDYRYTHYDPRTGAEGNPSPIMDISTMIDSARRGIDVTPTAYGDAAVRQRFYRRGGTLPTDWLFLGQNSSDGGVYADKLSDTEIDGSAAVEFDNDQPVSTVDASGNTILVQPLSSIWGPLDDLLFGCGDPHRPGHVYFCKPGEPDAWPSTNIVEVCAPSEQLQAGCLYGGQAFVFSTERCFVLYPNQATQVAQVTAVITQCKKGMVNRWGLAVGIGGMYFINRDGIYRTTGGPEEWLSRKIDPIFRGQPRNGVSPIDFSVPEKLRLEIHENELYFHYQDLIGNKNIMVYSIPYGFWRMYTFNRQTSCTYSDEGNPVSTLLVGSHDSGKTWKLLGYGDDGQPINCQVRTGSINFTRPREEKRFGDQYVDVDTQGVEITLQNYINEETITNPTQTLDAVLGRKRTIFDSFGTTPQRGRSIATDISWSSQTAAPVLYALGTSMIVEPDITVNRVTQWHDLGHPDESYLMGVTFDCDTGGEDRTIIVEYDFAGAISVAATLTVNTNGRHKVKFSWPAVQAHKVRIRPNDDCVAWILYKCDWIFLPEPPRIARWDVHFENAWDQYYTGLDLFCDTGGQNKTVEIYVDGNLIQTETVNTSGRKVHHVTLPWGRGHVFRFVATDDNPGLLYEYRWHLQAEPSEQANWNQNFTVAGSEADKFLKAIVFQCDTFGQNKTVTVECDGVVVETLTVNTNGRRVVQFAFPQHLGRVFRVYPTDSNPGRLYSLWWVFDQEPLALPRWETQEIDSSIAGWHYPIYANITLKSVSDVTLTVTAYNQSGVPTVNTYTIPSTGGLKTKTFVPFVAVKGILFKYVLTSTNPFWLYREETHMMVRAWGTNRTVNAKPFGNDDLDPTRVMTRAESSAARSGGGTG